MPIIFDPAADAGLLVVAETTAPATAFCMKLRLFMMLLLGLC
jgi:hypothetical protein